MECPCAPNVTEISTTTRSNDTCLPFNVSRASTKARGILAPPYLDHKTRFGKCGRSCRAKGQSLGATLMVDVRTTSRSNLYHTKSRVGQEIWHLDDTCGDSSGWACWDGKRPLNLWRKGNALFWCSDDHEGVGQASLANLALQERTLKSGDRPGGSQGNVDQGVVWNVARLFPRATNACFEFNLVARSGHKATCVYQPLQQPYFEKYLVEENWRGAVRKARAIEICAGRQWWSQVMAQQGDQCAASTSIRRRPLQLKADWVNCCEWGAFPPHATNAWGSALRGASL